MALGGVGSAHHINGELFKMMAGVNLVHVPYRGAGPALVDLLAGQVQVSFPSMPSSIEYVRAGKLRALAVTTATRSEALPDLQPSASSCRAMRQAVGSASARPRLATDRHAEISNDRNYLAWWLPLGTS